MSIVMQINPYEFFADTQGGALDAGYIWIGQANLDPRQYPITVYYDSALTLPAAQPLRTSNGYVVRNGSPTFLYVNGNYSVRVEDSRNRQVFYVPDFLLIGSQQPVTFSDLSNTTDVTKGDALIGVKQPYPGAVATTQHNKNAETVSLRDFGAVGDYVIGIGGTNDSVAFQAALNACSVTGAHELNLGSGTFLVTQTLTSQPVMLRGEPGCTTIVFKNMAGSDGFVFSPTTEIGRVIGADGIEFVVEGQNMGTMFSGPQDSSQYFDYYLTYHITNNFCRGANRVPAKYSFAWDFGAASWFTIGDCTGAEFSNNNIQGAFDIKVDPAGQLHDVGVTLDANGAVLSLRMYGNNIGPIYQGLRVLDKAFMNVFNNDFIGTYDSIIWEGTTLFNEPKISNNNMNAQRYGVVVDGPDGLAFTGNTIRRHNNGWKGGATDWYGFRIANGSDIKFRGNTVQPDESGGSFPGTQYGYNLLLVGLGTLSDNFVGVNCDQGITLTNCTGITVNGTVSAQNQASDALFRLTQNTRRTSIGSYELVSSFVGDVLSKDGTIVDAIQMLNKDFDLQSTGAVNFDMTRVNAAVDSKKWRTVVSTTSINRQAVSDAGSGTNYELITRTGTVIDEIQWRAGQLRVGNAGPIIKAGSGSPEGSITAPPGSLWLQTTSGGGNYQKLTGTGNTGWVTI